MKWVTTLRTHTVCPRSSDSFYIVTYNMKWVTTSQIHATNFCKNPNCKRGKFKGKLVTS